MRAPSWILSFAGTFVVALSVALPHASAQVQTAKVTGGELRGSVQNSVAIFKGIPFAAPPVGKLRWRAPQPVNAWEGVREATAFAPPAMQGGRGPVAPSEDCLYLNLWTPAKDASERLPVMVWIHGGGFSGGSSSEPLFDGTKLAHQGVIVVTIAYRLGAFGFLAHPELSQESGAGSGSYGIQDQIAALQWVHNNITQFGGDSSRVTIFGESAGAIAVSMLTVAPNAKGLFQRAISQSGGSMAPNMFGGEAGQNVPTLELAERQGKEFLARLGARDIEAARGLPAQAILRAGGRFWPVADGATIPGDQYELFEAGRFHDVPILIGTNSDEGALFGSPPTTPTAFEKLVRDRYGPAAEAILAAYEHGTDAQAAKATKDLFRESGFAWHTWAWAGLQSKVGKAPAYVYYFQHHTNRSPDGANHGAEIGYVFGTNLPRNPQAPALSALMMAYWTNFAKTGDPNGKGLPLWPRFGGDESKAMILDTTAEARPLPNLEKLKAFDQYYAWRRAEAKSRARRP